MTDKKLTDEDPDAATAPAPDTDAPDASAPSAKIEPEIALEQDQEPAPEPDSAPDSTPESDPDAAAEAKRKADEDDEDDTPEPADPWGLETLDTHGATAPAAAAGATVDPFAEPAPKSDVAEDEPVRAEEIPDEHHDDFEDQPRPSLAARALRGLVILLIGGGVALWAAPKVAPMLPASISKHLVVAVPVEVAEFDAYREASAARIGGLESALNDRAKALADDIAVAGKSGQTAAEVDAKVAAAVDAVNARIATLEDTLKTGDLTGLAARISALETQAAGLAGQLDSLAGGLKNVGAETGQVGEMSQDAVARLAANAAQLDGLRAQIQQLAAQSGSLAQRLDQAETDALTRAALAEKAADQRAGDAAAAAEQAKAAAVARARVARIEAGLDEIAAAIDTGAPYADALSRIDAEAPAGLTASAATGVPTMAVLRADFVPAAHAAIRAAAVAEADGGTMDKLFAGFKAQFNGVPTTAVGGEGVDAILGEASQKLSQDDVTGALAAIDALPPAAAAPLADWTARAKLRGDAKSALADWRAALTKTDG